MEKTQTELFKAEMEALLLKYPSIRLQIAQTIQIGEVPASVSVV